TERPAGPGRAGEEGLLGIRGRHQADRQLRGVARALQHTDQATTVRVRNGKISTTDGPFAETKEQLGGYFLIEAKDRNEAIQIASRIPSAKWGSVEVRPVWSENGK